MTVLVVVSVLVLCSCERTLLPLQGCILTGDAEVMANFKGGWYESEGELGVAVEAGSPGELRVRLPGGFNLDSARTVGEEVHFSVHSERVESVVSLRLLEPDSLVMVRPGGEPSWCGTCTPYLERLSRADRLGKRMRRIPEATESAYEAAIDWLAGVL